MKFSSTACLSVVVFSLISCSSVSSSVSSTPPRTSAPSPSRLSSSDKQKIGRKIWKNESGGTINGLTQWNAGEEFPSLGIGHFIWYPKGFNGRWTESFPLYIRYARQHGDRNIPRWVLNAPDCPWSSRTAFNRDFNGKKLKELRNYLAHSIPLQTDFIIATSRAALPKILASAPASQRARIRSNYHKVASTPTGIYALIDYVNFKGDGTNPTERYNNQGWGLMWVLMEMKPTSSGKAASREFAAAAKRCLDRRITNSPPTRGESRWRKGWHNRCNTYIAQ